MPGLPSLSPSPATVQTARRWDIFCRVVDNLGDAGVCWRLAADLAARGQRVRLFIDDMAPLDVMAPLALRAAAGVEVCGWPAAAPAVTPGDVVIEAFGCDPPPAFVAAMARQQAQQQRQPCWINLEYLSAEAYVERSHRLPSPQANGLRKWFFYPGFTPRTGGLLREPGLLVARAAFAREAWLSGHGVVPRSGERVVTLFCYDGAPVPALLHSLARAPTLLLLTAGAAQRQVDGAPNADAPPTGLRVQRLPWLTQHDFDRLLWASDINIVRGEDSLVRALWAGAPFVWQAYPQHDGAHAAKLDALIARLELPHDMAALWRAWNGLAPWPGWPGQADLCGWQDAVRKARAALLAQPDLVTQLLDFVAATP